MRRVGSTFILCFVCTLSVSGAGATPPGSWPWEASPVISQQLTGGQFLRIEVTNIEAQDICINRVSWPGAEGEIVGDTVKVRGKHQPLWEFTGVEKYPTKEIVRVRPGATIATTVDLRSYYMSSVPGDVIVEAFWGGGFVYCSYVSRRE